MKPEDVVIGQRYAIIDNTGKVDIGEMGDSYRHARPVQKKAEPAPDRNQTFEPAELEAMQEEAMLESIENHKPEIIVPDPEQSRYAALKKRLDALEAKDEDLSSWQKRFGDAVDRLTARMNLIFDKVNKL